MPSPLPNDANMLKEVLRKWVWEQENVHTAFAFVVTC